MWNLYHLRDAADNIRYVGLTDDLERRLSQHLCRSVRIPSPVGFWLQSLPDPSATMRPVESFDRDEAFARTVERFEIRRQWEAGWQLLNIHALQLHRDERYERAWGAADYAVKAWGAGVRASRHMWIANRMTDQARSAFPAEFVSIPFPSYEIDHETFLSQCRDMFAGPELSQHIQQRPATLRELGFPPAAMRI